MSLVFGGATSDRVTGTNFGTNPTVWTCYWWHNLTTITNDRKFFTKTGTGVFTIQLAAAGDASRLRLLLDYTSDSAIISTAGAIVTGAWQFVAVTGNHTTSAPRAYIGSLTTPPTEIGYGTQSTPTGSRITDGGAAYIIGNTSGGPDAIQGSMSVFSFINGTALSLAEITQHWMRPQNHANTKVLMHLGYNGTGTQPDWSGHGNSGTVTGATVGAHVPLGPLFGFDSESANDAQIAAATRQILVGRRASLAGPGGFAA